MSEAVADRASRRARPSPADRSTPSLIVDLDLFDANVDALAVMLDGSGKTVRPHVKTHRTPELARRQLGGPAAGITCATIGEVEAFVQAGFDDVLLANEVVGASKIERLVRAAREARVTVAVDAPDSLPALSRAALGAQVSLGVLIDVDVLIHRCGVGTAAEAIALADAIERLPGIELVGVMGFEGRVRPQVVDRASRIAAAYGVLGGIATALRAAGHRVDVVSAAGTSTVREAIADPTITEIQAGVYCLMEPELRPLGLPFRCAAVVRASVISRHRGRIVLDAGRRVLGVEYGPPLPSGFAGEVVAVSDEHTTVEITGAVPPLGAELDLVPGQVRTTFNLHDWVWVERRGQVIEAWPVSARGRSW
jgi:D-serine deaminase-like pyridoxal phosphate-dependent protein